MASFALASEDPNSSVQTIYIDKTSSAEASMPQKNESTIDNRGGFFLQLSLGLAYGSASAEGRIYDDYYDERWNCDQSVSGLGFGFDAKIGGTIKGLVSVYADLGMNFVADEAEVSSQSEKFSYDAGLFDFFIGAGVNVYPFRRVDHPLYGFYAGLGYGLLIGVQADETDGGYEYNSNTDYEIDPIIVLGAGLKLAVGKVFKLGRRINLGVETYVMLATDVEGDSEIEELDDDYDVSIDYDTFAWGLSFVFMIK